MTTPKPKKTHKTTTTHEPKKQYTSFYLFMLVIGVCITISSIATVADIPRLIAYYVHAPVFTTLMLLDYVAVAVAAVGLVYLFRKKYWGLVLTLGALAAQFVLSFLLFFFIDQMVAYTVAGSNSSDFSNQGEKDAFISFMKAAMYVAMPFGLVVTGGLAVAWHFAWQKQYRADHSSHKH
jgi:hypothetical protein